MVTQTLFCMFLGVLATQRLLELERSRRNEERMRAAGGQEHSPEHFGVMRAMHVAWFAAMPLEVFLLQRPFTPGLAAVGLAMLLAGQALRYHASRSLGWRWSVRIYTVPGLPLVRHGLYRYLRHPIYLGVALELAGTPLIHGAWLTSLAFSLLNAAVLRVRIRAEERALELA
ncbi:MAG: isoprenylcysteine carboxylmethyltransferase family protein [Candidatus Eremiobacterota bacterium]